MNWSILPNVSERDYPSNKPNECSRRGSSDGFPNKISVNHFISPDLFFFFFFCEEEQLFISIKPWNCWLAGGWGVGEGRLEDADNEVPEKGDFLTIKPWSEPERGHCLQYSPLPLGIPGMVERGGRDAVTNRCGKGRPGRLWDLLLGKCWTRRRIFLECVLWNPLPQAFLRHAVNHSKKFVK